MKPVRNSPPRRPCGRASAGAISNGLKIALICGGPSPERGISLNSARSVMDHLGDKTIEIVPFYLDQHRRAYGISPGQLYSNTPSDFDFKLVNSKVLNSKQFAKALKECDTVFPVIHGAYGEDGGIQSFLEKNKIPFVGSSSKACKKAFDKFYANEYIREKGFFTLPSVVLKIYRKDHRTLIDNFFKRYNIRRAIVKPATGGSSIGVFSVSSSEEALERVNHLFSKRVDTRVVVEPFAEGVEFTVIILENSFGLPVALPPTEIETDYRDHQIFDFRKKYLPTRHVTYHSPPRFGDDTIERIQAMAEQLFALFGMNDFARFDGWVLPSGDIWFSDFNPISGMEQNSFLFQQGARAGMTHKDILRYVVANTARRQGLSLPQWQGESLPSFTRRKPVSVLFGGPTSERQVSLMSGTNVWLKLRSSLSYEPRPYLLDTDGSIWRVPYHLLLNHTIEEISQNCRTYAAAKKRLAKFEERARLHLGLSGKKNFNEFFDPEKMTLNELTERSEFIFDALHGGIGEDGTVQRIFEKQNVKYNGSNEQVSKLCIDKWATKEFIEKIQIGHVGAVPGILLETDDLNEQKAKEIWASARKRLSSKSFVVKPRGDGCSTGIVRLYSVDDIATYIRVLKNHIQQIPKGTFKNQTDIVEMPTEIPDHLILEKFIETDILLVKNNVLKHTRRYGWIEITVGVIEIQGKLHALNPSITIAEGEVLSVEEKFQGGTGVNLTPPPSSVMKPSTVLKIRKKIEELANRIGIQGYSRIDAFAHVRTGELLIIEINTLPGLTPSTVLFHQALAEDPPIYPRELLELLIKNKDY